MIDIFEKTKCAFYGTQLITTTLYDLNFVTHTYLHPSYRTNCKYKFRKIMGFVMIYVIGTDRHDLFSCPCYRHGNDLVFHDWTRTQKVVSGISATDLLSMLP